METAKPTNGVITCPYHGWCYKTCGTLTATPHINGQDCHTSDEFDPSLHGLKEVRTHIFAGMIFVNISGQAAEFDTFIQPVTDHWKDIDFNQYAHGISDSHWQITIESNWKFAQENHVDGYHLPFVHPSLHSYSPLRDHYPLIIEGRACGQGSANQDHSSEIGTLQLPKNPALDQRWQSGKAEFLSVYPNIMIGVQADHFWTVHLLPVSPSRTLERMDLHYFGEGATNAKYAELRANNCQRMLDIFEEDRAVVEGMQRGRHSPAFSGGALSPAMDKPAHCFNKIVAGEVLSAIIN